MTAPNFYQLVCVVLNKWRYDTPVDEFISWCRKVAEFNNQRTLPVAQGDMEQDHGKRT